MINNITDSEQIGFRNEIFQRYLNVFFKRLILFGHVIIHYVTIV